MAERIEATTRRVHASLIVAHHAGDRGLTALVAARHTATPLTVLVHGAEWTHKGWLRDAAKARLVCRSADHVIANSGYTAQLCREATGRDVVDIINPGVDHAAFTPRVSTDTEVDEPVPVVLFVGELHPRKGADVLASAIRLLPDDLKVRFVFAGPGGSLGPTLRTTIQQSGRSDDVSVIGPVPPDALPDLYRAADVLVFPTVWPTEGFGMVAAEAMACGIPVVASQIAAIPEVVLDGQTGLLFAPGDAGDLAQKLLTLLADRPLRLSLGRQGAIEAERYDWSHVAEALLADAVRRAEHREPSYDGQ
jgi:glycosyltransferase involved in cell wall biosynthesis